MPRVRALRGVCIGVEQHLVRDDVVEMDVAQVQFLTSIGAVEVVPDAPADAVIETSAKAGKKEK